MREARDKLSAEIAGMGYDELTHWLRTHQYPQPVLKRLGEMAVRQADAAAHATPRR
jgi:hypothetical protein